MIVLRSIRCISAFGAALMTLVGLAACGSGTSDSAVVRVGQTTITKATVDHWVPVMTSGLVAVSYLPKQPGQTPRQRALGFLISSEWLIGEAADEGLKVSAQEIDQRFEKKHDSFPDGDAEFHEFLKATRQTVADVKFGIEAELASSKIRQSREPKITQAQIVGYYDQNKQRYLVPEQRYFDIDNLQSKAEARRVKREVELGKNFAKIALHESLEQRPMSAIAGSGKEAIARAVFSARPNVLSGPVRLYRYYSLFEVRRIVPATHRPLAQVQNSIKQRLAAEQRRPILTELVKTWRNKWIAKTSCRTGYVVPNCKQYKGPAAPEATI